MLYVMKKSGFVLTLTLLVLLVAAFAGANAAFAAEKKQIQAAPIPQDQTTENGCFIKSAAGLAWDFFTPVEALAETPLIGNCIASNTCQTIETNDDGSIKCCSDWKTGPNQATEKCQEIYSCTP